MGETLHRPSAATAAAGTTSIPFHHHHHPHSAPKNLQFRPPPPAKPPTVSLKSPDGEAPPSASAAAPAALPPEKTQIQDLLLYLDSLGVDSLRCLHSYPPLLSAPLPQIRSTVDFLLSLGVTAQDLRRVLPMCPELLTSPTSSVVVPAATFLLREAGVLAADLRHVIHRRPRLLTCSVDRRLRPTLYFLQGTIGIEQVSKWAPLLSCSVEDKFVPRIEYMQRLGFPYRDTIAMFRKFPSLFCYSIKENFEPKFDYFLVEMGREMKELVAFPQYFSFSLENRIKPRHRACMEKGIYLPLPTMLKSPEAKFRERLDLCYSSSLPVRDSPLWRTNVETDIDDNVT
ncbi:Mitochondrial transcription termination factor family protein [Striga hermonthica]|uniref:Mitochondrial transcription termination factor family protein n=1 Tax=Striga hermonthica TaxID=68872 RepID=A0A9N7N7I6_STRHE|nr:Mitochondrial transcription termination factor family protein [Striga hermonthica]